MVCLICNKYENEDLFDILNLISIYVQCIEGGLFVLRSSIENVESFWYILKAVSLKELKRLLYIFIEGALHLCLFNINE